MTTSFILNKQNHQFLSSYTKSHSLSKSKAINHALDMLRKYVLQKEMREGFSKQSDEDVAGAMSDFADYIKIIESEQ
jgi:hypothetical protein